MAQTVYTNTKILIYLDDKPLASAGGEGTVYCVISTGTYLNSCVKIYHPPKRTIARRNKIEFMIKNKPNVLSSSSYVICWPTEMVFDNNGNFLGFLMSLAFSGSESLYELTRTKTPKQLQQQWSKFDRSLQSGIEKRLRICVNIAIAVHSIHQSGKYAIVDYKPQNILITSDGKISITDVDSFQIANNGVVIFHSEVATPEYAPPESARINPSKSMISDSWDRFSFAVSFYEILFGIHPFAASCDSQYQTATTIGDKIRNGLFVHGSKKKYLTVIPSIHNNFKHLPASLIQLFFKAFDEGHTNDKARPTAEQWGNAIYAELKSKKGIKAHTIFSPQRNISPITTINRTTIASNTTTYTRPSPQTTTTGKTKNIYTTILIWLFIVIAGVAFFAFYRNKTAKNTINNTTHTTISSVNRTGYISAKEFANIRNGPSTNYGIIAKKYRGESVYVIEKDLATDWYKVRYISNGNIGYISNELISFDQVKTIEPQIPPSNVGRTSTQSTSKLTTIEEPFISQKVNGSSPSDTKEPIRNVRSETKLLSTTNDIKPNPYGTGNGQVTIYHTCSDCRNVKISIDSYYSGTLTKYYLDGSPECGIQSDGGSIVKNLSKGNHIVTAKDDYGNFWSGSVNINESQCKTYALQNFIKANPYGNGNGSASFWTDNDVIYKLYIDENFQNNIRQHFSGGDPVCGQAGTVSIILPAGKHSFMVKNDKREVDDLYYSQEDDKVWKGTFYVIAGQCISIKVNKGY